MSTVLNSPGAGNKQFREKLFMQPFPQKVSNYVRTWLISQTEIELKLSGTK